MKALQFLELVTNNAKRYAPGCKESLIRNGHMNRVVKEDVDNLDDEMVEAILVDFINFIGRNQGVDYALYTRDLKKEK